MDCGRLTLATRCVDCMRARDRRRGSSYERGYGPTHRQARANLRTTLPALCGYGCGVTLWPNGRWVAAHVVDGRPEHGWIASCIQCNASAQVRGQGRGGSATRTDRGPL